jgi:flavorubredoxin
MIAYTSVYGNTAKAATILADKLEKTGCPKVVVTDLAREDMAEAVEDAFRYGKIVLASPTYNGDVFPFMKTFIDHLLERSYQNKTIGFIENGSWAPMAAKVMKGKFENSKNITLLDTVVSIKSAVKEADMEQLEALAKELMK